MVKQMNFNQLILLIADIQDKIILLLQFYCNLNCPKNNFKERGFRQPSVKFILSQVHWEVTYGKINFKPSCSITSQTFSLFDKFYGTFALCADVNHLQIAAFAW